MPPLGTLETALGMVWNGAKMLPVETGLPGYVAVSTYRVLPPSQFCSVVPRAAFSKEVASFGQPPFVWMPMAKPFDSQMTGLPELAGSVSTW